MPSYFDIHAHRFGHEPMLTRTVRHGMIGFFPRQQLRATKPVVQAHHAPAVLTEQHAKMKRLREEKAEGQHEGDRDFGEGGRVARKRLLHELPSIFKHKKKAPPKRGPHGRGRGHGVYAPMEE